ncbi:mechanosensitive ion channel [Devosia algicola]|uniref:Mechanosensitive ion channel n=1 Tax=Devosia algicola TaxID=3026418 RepID=A0ABY7YKW2_9HYPH|nr:mechanosensitive ion channel domain-containing protein [Devosia algicola]WDR01931.1 mechanosensitive ion channel [Devosia algicola]
MDAPIILAQVQMTPAAQPETAETIIEDVSSGVAPIMRFVTDTAEALGHQFLSYEGLFQVGTILGAFVVSWLVAGRFRPFLAHVWPVAEGETAFVRLTRMVVLRLAFPVLFVLALWMATAAFSSLNTGNDLIRTVASLLQAWVLIRLFSTFVRDPFWSRAFASVAWFIAALNILRLLNPTIALLDSMSVSVGADRISVFMVIKGVVALTALVWLASIISRFVQSRVDRQDNLPASVKGLVSQAVRIVFLFAAIMLAMNVIGIDLTALAVFSGAVGVGIGFGLQAIFSNLVSGIILLVERSIKVGDFVELESGLTGEVREINIRSARITTSDNVDILVPNSEFINNRVTNWTFRDNYKRTRIPFGVAYGTDKELVKKAALEAAETVPHMLKGRGAKPPEVWLVNFGESSLDFELVVWIKPESVKRPAKVHADYNWALETALASHGIEIPFPQRDLHIRSGELPVKLTGQAPKKSPSRGGSSS